MTKNRYKIVMIPTLQKANSSSMVIEKCIKKLSDVNINDLKYTPRILHSEEYFQEQHLYIIDTQAKIEVGNWVYKKDVKGFIYKHKLTKNEWYNDEVKIVASTDTSLRVGGNTGKRQDGISIPLPIIPKQFVQEYIQEQFEYVPEKYICKKCDSLAINSKAITNYHHIDKSYYKEEVEFKTKLGDCFKCSSCCHSWINSEKTNTREQLPDELELCEAPNTLKPELQTILKACYKAGINSVTFPADNWNEKKLFLEFTKDYNFSFNFIFWRNNHKLNISKENTVHIWKDWYMTIKCHS